MTQAAEFDHNVFSATEQEADKSTLARFLVKSVQDHTASTEEGRPVFKDVEYIEIRIAGNRTDFVCRPATFRDKERFPRHYEAFQKRVELPEQGTPLVEWPQITRSQAEELSFHNIKTVEQLAAVSDSSGQNFMGFHSLRNKATQFLEIAKEGVSLQALKDELKERDARIGELESKLNTLIDRLAAPSSGAEAVNTLTSAKEKVAIPTAHTRRRAKK